MPHFTTAVGVPFPREKIPNKTGIQAGERAAARSQPDDNIWPAAIWLAVSYQQRMSPRARCVTFETQAIVCYIYEYLRNSFILFS